MPTQSRRAFCQSVIPAALLGASSLAGARAFASVTAHSAPGKYIDGRPAATLRLDGVDGGGPILRYGTGPNHCDSLGAREAICFRSGDTYYLYYDGAGPTGWLACLATSRDLRHWDLKGPALQLGAPGRRDEKSASAPWTVFDGKLWHMFYLGATSTTPPPKRIPLPPYFTLTATSKHPGGPWTKQYQTVPFLPKPGTYYSDEASPGQIVKQGDEYLMFFSAATNTAKKGKPLDYKRTLSIARTRNLDGPWKVNPEPILPSDQQVENSALYFEPANRTWFLFTNHVGINKEREEYDDAIWVYWSKSLTRWDAEKRAIVLDSNNCHWAAGRIGMPSVVKVGNRLALFYDASTSGIGNMKCDLGLGWMSLPLRPPA